MESVARDHSHSKSSRNIVPGQRLPVHGQKDCSSVAECMKESSNSILGVFRKGGNYSCLEALECHCQSIWAIQELDAIID